MKPRQRQPQRTHTKQVKVARVATHPALDTYF